ncbi:MAG: tRNA-queuosine alpha-mannosyltransferase domain-containing protein [Planctomycetota bacterium]|jgi:glycosyltransferase involved in cell wall biosynthesis
MSLRILALNAFHGGSHRAFLDGWSDHSRHEFTPLTLPGTKWKWRARHSAVWFAEQLGQQLLDSSAPTNFDVLFCTDMLNLAEFLGLCPECIRRLPRVVYFHENQLTYPNRSNDDRDLHLAYSNLTTSLAADAVWFNSEFHRRDFLTALRDFLQRMPDRRQPELVDRIEERSAVQSPGISLIAPAHDRASGPLRIAWVSRWEHDKRPDIFFAALRLLIERGCDFRVRVLGEAYRNSPACFAQAHEWLADHIDHWGLAPTRHDYETLLRNSDIVVSTADHEFFGIAVLEAVSAGCLPVVPRALAYPETLGQDLPTFHDGTPEDVARQLQQLAETIPPARLKPDPPNVSRFDWKTRTSDLDGQIEGLVRKQRPRVGQNT